MFCVDFGLELAASCVQVPTFNLHSSHQLGETKMPTYGVFTVLPAGFPTLRDFLTNLNVIRPNIKMSMQLEKGRRWPFIGVQVTRRPDNHLRYAINSKHTHTKWIPPCRLHDFVVRCPIKEQWNPAQWRIRIIRPPQPGNGTVSCILKWSGCRNDATGVNAQVRTGGE